jgi:hypothetical protein
MNLIDARIFVGQGFSLTHVGQVLCGNDVKEQDFDI